MKRFVKDNFVDRRNSINLSLTRSKAAESTYFLGNCAIVFGWVFHRLCNNLRPFNVLYESSSSTFYAPLLFFSHIQIFRACLEFSSYLHGKLIFTKYLRWRQHLRRFDIVLPQKFSSTFILKRAIPKYSNTQLLGNPVVCIWARYSADRNCHREKSRVIACGGSVAIAIHNLKYIKDRYENLRFCMGFSLAFSGP